MTLRGALLLLFAIPAFWCVPAWAETPPADVSVIDSSAVSQSARPRQDGPAAPRASIDPRTASPLRASEAPSATDDGRRAEAARALADSADEAFRHGDYEPAVRNARAAFALVPAPTLVLLEARALRELGHWNDAMARYRLAIQIDELPPNPVFVQAKRAARVELQDLQTSIPRIRIAHQFGGAVNGTVRLDGALLPPESFDLWLAQDPGKHTILYTDEAGGRQSYAVDLKPGDERRLVVGEAAAPGRKDVVRAAAGWATLGIGGASLAAGIGLGVRAKKLQNDLDGECTGNSCPPRSRDTLRQYRTTRDFSTAAYVMGGTGIATGAALLWIWPLIARGEDSWTAQVTPASITFGRAF